ncbi:MAG TPA: histidine kinase [Puia sp.]|jgi:sensor histidine kinase YesM|nr:histidine kinase [Puia sp.]
MSMHEFIFSDDRRTRISRHLIFWIGWYFYMVCTQVRNQTPQDIGMKNFIIYQLGVSANRLLLQMIFCYTMVYFLVPNYLQKNKYKSFFIALVAVVFCFYWITYFDFLYVWSDKTSPVFFNVEHVIPLSPFLTKYFSIYSNIHFTGSLVSCSIILVIKYYKSWYRKQRENEMLIQENSQAELQLLKAQVHPHFLFNTLNNIYALTLSDSSKAATAVQKLSGMVFYMNNEGAGSFVQVSKEIKMLLDYVGLEKIRYGERLKMIIDIRQNADSEMMIAPLLMIPLVENCFKHGASKILDQSYINIFIETKNEWLEFKISNSLPDEPEKPEDRKKIGLTNVKKRLQLLYPGNHQLDIQSSADSFSVSMKIKLEKKKTQPEEILPHKILSYAR